MDAVGHHNGFGLGIHLKYLTGIKDTLIAVVFALSVEHERNHGNRVGHSLDFLVQLKMYTAEEKRVERVVMDEQTIRDANNTVNLGRESA